MTTEGGGKLGEPKVGSNQVDNSRPVENGIAPITLGELENAVRGMQLQIEALHRRVFRQSVEFERAERAAESRWAAQQKEAFYSPEIGVRIDTAYRIQALDELAIDVYPDVGGDADYDQQTFVVIRRETNSMLFTMAEARALSGVLGLIVEAHLAEPQGERRG
jgi:hypothetical protein